MDDINDTSSNNVDSNNFITSYDDYYAFVDSLINNVENNITTNVPLADSDFAPVVDNNKELDEYLNSFPPGYKFKPHDEELIVYYLKKKILNEPLPPNRIYEVELYKFNPETLAANYASSGDGQREKEWYFFTSRDRKYPNGIRPRRDAGDGHWKATGADKIIKFNGVVVGLKKTLVFHKGKAGDGGDKTEWLMHEYRVNDPPKRKRNDDDMKLDDWVLCRIYTKTKSLTQPQEQAIQVEEPLEIGNVNLLAEQMVGADYLDYSGFAASPSSSNFPFHYSQLPIDQEYVHHLPN